MVNCELGCNILISPIDHSLLTIDYSLPHLQHRPYLLCAHVLEAGIVDAGGELAAVESYGIGSGGVFGISEVGDYFAGSIHDLY